MMIWHMYDNNDKVIVTDSPNQIQYIYNSSPSSSVSVDIITDEEDSSEENAIKKSYASPDSKSLFLKFSSDSNNRKKSTTQINNKELSKKKTSIKVNGVNILNRKNLDSKTIAERIQKRRETHNDLERRRRDGINNTIYELANVLPSLPEGQKFNKHNVLKSALNYILFLQSENEQIKQALQAREPVQNSPHASVRNGLDSAQIHQLGSGDPRSSQENGNTDFQVKNLL